MANPNKPFARKLYLFSKLLEYKLSRIRSKTARDSVLIVNLDNMGDLILFSPLVLAVKEKLCFHVSLLVAERNLELAAAIPGVDTVLMYKRDYIPYYPADEEMKYYLKHQSLFKELQGTGFRVGISVSTNDFNASCGNLLVDFLGCERKIAFNRGLFSGRMTDLVNIDSALHWTENYLALGKPLGIPMRYIPPILYFLPEKGGCAFSFKNEAPIIAIQPGGRNNYPVSKLWPIDNFIELADILTGKGYAIAVLGDKDDRGVGCLIEEALKGKPVTNLCGQTGLKDLSHFLGQVEGYVSNDTGTLHFANAVGCKKVVAVFGPTSHERLMPRGENCQAVTSDLDCAPCVGNEFPERCKQERQICLEKVTVDAVIEALLR
jgi:ADP-heptose:LPS heptosyltransferase